MERDFIRSLRGRLPQHERILVGPGDDAAVLRAGGDVVVTTDLLMDGVDFILRDIDPRRAGRKALAVNLSDLAAMAARPLAAFVSLALPIDEGSAIAEALYDGMLPLAEEFGCAIAGGDTNSWRGPLVISVTAVGETTSRGPLLRSGAKAGDAIVVTGGFGFSIQGRHFDFTPRVREALLLHERYTLHAGIDASDGLSLDLWRLCEESGCGAILEASAIPMHDGWQALFPADDRESSLRHALGDGEDFELILGVPPADAERLLAEQPCAATPLTRIGQFVAEPGLWLRTFEGHVERLTPQGYEHRL
jgi:thiamine-monophosphate kinase